MYMTCFLYGLFLFCSMVKMTPCINVRMDLSYLYLKIMIVFGIR